MDGTRTKVLVIGGGPAGYVCAIRAGQLGLDTILVEEGRLGGTCLNVGCIPSKAFIHAATAFHHARGQEATNAFGLSVTGAALDFPRLVAWKDGIVGRLNSGVAGLLKKAKVRVVRGRAELVDGKTCIVEADGKREKIRAEHLVLATGSKSVELPGLPFGGDVISSTEALSLPEPPRRLAVVGAGYIGLELGTAFAKLGSEVTAIEAEARILPAWDAELTRPVAKRLEALGVTVMLGVKAQGLTEDGLAVRTAEGNEVSVEADKTLVAVGREARLEGFGLERLDLAMTGRFLKIDERCRTSMRDVWAIGDVTGEPMLAHRAMAQGEMVAELIAGRPRRWDKVAIPAICFTDPEIVAVGLLPEEARAAGHEIKVAQFPFAANGRAMTQGDEAGFVRVVARADNHLVLGVQAVGWEVSEFASAFSLALEMGARLEDIAGTIHAHPSRGEAIQEAALAALGHALHI